jgi:hypothetical protein
MDNNVSFTGGPTEATEVKITLTNENGLTVDKMSVEVASDQTLIFESKNVSARIFMPQRVFEPADQSTEDAVKALTVEAGGYLLFDIDSGGNRVFTPYEQDFELHYAVSTNVALSVGGNIERAPVIIIVKKENS